MTASDLRSRLENNEPILFEETLSFIEANYHYQPTHFQNGDILNPAGVNQGSCKTFALAKLLQLNPEQTLQLFGEHYRDVLKTPEGNDHANIRQFIKTGWSAIQFEHNPLQVR